MNPPAFIALAVAFVSSYYITKSLVKKEKELGITGPDMNKEGKPQVASIGGIALFFAFLASSPFLLIGGVDKLVLSCVLGASAIIEILGLVDDLLKLRQVAKAFLPGIAALALLPLTTKAEYLVLPFLGKIPLGVFYPTFFVPIGLMGASNLANMLAGYNGLESGLTLLILVALGCKGMIIGKWTSAMVALTMAACCLGFYLLNRFPAKIFPGDAGTLLMGAWICLASIALKEEALAALLMAPHLLDFVIKAVHRFPGDTWANVKNGKLSSPNPPRGLMHLLLHLLGPKKEDEIVRAAMAIQVGWCILMLAFSQLIGF